jgi:hypothetical protein
MLRTRWLPAVLAAVGVLGVAAPVRAGLLPVNVTILPEAAHWRWTYSIVVPTDQYITSGDYFTIYDFEGLMGDAPIEMPEGWSVTVQNVGKTPGLTTPIDDETKPNLSFIYTGDPIYGGVGAGNFSAASTMGNLADGMFTSRTHRNSDNKTEDSITFTDVPRPSGGGGEPPPPPTSETPEPATLALFGIGLPALGLARVIRRRKAA